MQENVLLGKRITEARERKGWSRSDLARRANVDPSYVTRIEEAHYKRPSVDKVKDIANALGIQVNDLVEQPVPSTTADLRVALMARGFRPDETHIVDKILADLAGRPERSRQQVLDAVATLLALRDGDTAAS